MFKVKELDVEGMRKAENDLAKWKKTYKKIFKIVNKINNQTIEYKKSCRSNEDFISKMNSLKQFYKKDYELNFIDFFVRHYTGKDIISQNIILELDNDAQNPYLTYPPISIELDTSTNENKIMAIGFELRTGFLLSNDFNITIDTDVYKKFENILLENPDITDWFYLFIANIRNNFFLQIDETKKTLKYLTIIYESLTDEKKIEVDKKIQAYNLNEEITKRNINLEMRIGKKKNLIKPFIEFYKVNKEVLGKAESCFNEFKKNYPDIINDTYKSFEKTIYANGYRLK